MSNRILPRHSGRDTKHGPPEGGGRPPPVDRWLRHLGPEPEGLRYSFVFRTVTAIVAVLFGAAVLLVVGAFSGWEWESWMLPAFAAQIGLIVLIGEHLRSRVYERQLAKIEEDPARNVEALLLELGHPASAYRETQHRRLIYLGAKRALDLFASLVGLVLFSPLLLLVALFLKLDSPGPVFFTATRIGFNGRPFQLLKFRTMRQDTPDELLPHLLLHIEEERGLFKREEDPRVTPVGRFLRRTSLDELPRLFNVVRGELSLVGPRPLLPEEADFLEDSPLLEKLVGLKPGLVSAWSVLGSRSIASLEEALEVDLRFHRQASLIDEIFLLVRVVPAVLKRGGAV